MERTLVLIMPDAIQRRLIGEIIMRFESSDLTMVGLKLLVPSKELAEAHYDLHRDRPFFSQLVKFLTSGRVVALVLEKDQAVAITNSLIGPSDPVQAATGTIRGDYAISLHCKLVEASDSVENAQLKIPIWFKPDELFTWTPAAG